MMFDESFIEMIKVQEGCINHMYLDTRGYVTVGVGQMLPNPEAAMELPFVIRDSGEKATANQITEEFNRVKSQEPAKVARWYEQFTRLILLDHAIESLLNKRIVEFESGIKNKLPEYEEYPVPAKEALLDMAFNLGTNGLFTKFPTMIRYVKDKNWQGCSEECRRRGISDARNEFTKDLFLKALA